MRVVIVGFGVLGQNIAKILHLKSDHLLRHYGLRPKVVAVVDRSGAVVDPKGLDLREALDAKQSRKALGTMHSGEWHPGMRALQVIEEVECEAVLELTPTNVVDGEPALSHIKAALRQGRHVVTANKGPIAMALPSLLELAAHNGVLLKFSGTVGGGTPILDLAKRCFEGNPVRSAHGILNGTTNYILTRMHEDRVDMEEALAEAKRLGYAEEDPTYDVEGIDTGAKLTIVGNYIMGWPLAVKDVDITGIRGVTLDDVLQAEGRGEVVKLVGTLEDEEARVEPRAVKKGDPLAVRGPLNAITFQTELAGGITLVGFGAGGMETASAILRDLLDIRRRFGKAMA
jgi:homoserine dehydrogenase